MRRKLIAGNWKMNTDRAGGVALAKGIAERAGEVRERRPAGLSAVASTSLPVAEAVKGTNGRARRAEHVPRGERRVHGRDQRRDAARRRLRST